jgi:hypothetical protein
MLIFEQAFAGVLPQWGVFGSLGTMHYGLNATKQCGATASPTRAGIQLKWKFM